MTGMFGGRGTGAGEEGEERTMVGVEGVLEGLASESRGGVAGLSGVLIVSEGFAGSVLSSAGLLGVVPAPLSTWLGSLVAGLLAH